MILGVFVCQSLILLAQVVGIIDRHRGAAGASNKRRLLPQAGTASSPSMRRAIAKTVGKCRLRPWLRRVAFD